jgi:KDO2-lipid IV(A) lauroyltransferase
VSAIGRRIPLGRAQRMGRALGTLAFHVARRERNRAIRNLSIAYPDWTEEQRRQTIKEMFRHFGASIFELAWLPNMNEQWRARTTDIEGIDRILELLDSGTGVIMFTAHIGNWEWLSYVMGTYGRPVSVLHRERDQPQMNDYIVGLRARAGVHTIGRGTTSSAREMIQTLRRGGMLAFVIDQNIRTESVKVPFFGQPALTPLGPVRFAIRTEAMISISYIHRDEQGRHHATFMEPFQCRKDDDPVALAARITAEYEKKIRQHPEQWVWVHDRWRERPQWEVQPDAVNASRREAPPERRESHT